MAMVGVLAITAAPHAVLGYYTYLTYDTLQQVFSVESLADELEEERESSSPDPTPTPDEVQDAGDGRDDGLSWRGDGIAASARVRDSPDPLRPDP